MRSKKTITKRCGISIDLDGVTIEEAIESIQKEFARVKRLYPYGKDFKIVEIPNDVDTYSIACKEIESDEEYERRLDLEARQKEARKRHYLVLKKEFEK